MMHSVREFATTSSMLSSIVGHRTSSSSSRCIAIPTVVTIAQRGVVQSHTHGVSNLFDGYHHTAARNELRRNKGGNYYRYKYQRLWPSVEALEVAMTQAAYAPLERTPLALLPQRSAQQATLPVAVIEAEGEASQPCVVDEAAAPSIDSLIITDADVEGTVLASASSRRTTNDGDIKQDAVASRRRVAASELQSNMQSGISWHSLAHLIDPVVQQVAARRYGSTATKAQARLLSALLLNDDHKDVVFSAPNGSGKTSAMLLALVQSIRNEDAGLNVLVAANAIEAKRFVDQVVGLCGEHNDILDIGADEGNGVGVGDWLLMAPFREGVDMYARRLRQTERTHPDLQQGGEAEEGPRRRPSAVRLLVTTADVFCDLLFVHKVEFERLGYLRRVFVDDCATQLAMLEPTASAKLVAARLRDPVAVELLLGSLHQLPSPHIRAILQLACVSASATTDSETSMAEHLKALCLKPDLHTVVVSPIHSVPTTVHCSFCFHTHHTDTYASVAHVLRRASSTVVGRALIVIRQSDDVLVVRQQLRRHGMDVKMLSEIQKDATTLDESVPWKFLLIREMEGVDLHLPLVSHVVATFPPSSRASLLNLCGPTGWQGNYGWLMTVTDRVHAKQCRDVAEQLSVNFLSNVVSADTLEPVPEHVVDRWTAPPTMYGLDPQFAVYQHHEQLSENPDLSNFKREFFSKPVDRDFYLEDYTPLPELHRRSKAAMKLAREVEADPKVGLQMQNDGFLDANFKPTKRLRTHLHHSQGGAVRRGQ